MKKALGYIRVSSEEQADHGLGLESQRQRIRTYCEMKGLDLTTIYEDPAVSGGKALGIRPSGARLSRKRDARSPWSLSRSWIAFSARSPMPPRPSLPLTA